MHNYVARATCTHRRGHLGIVGCSSPRVDVPTSTSRGHDDGSTGTLRWAIGQANAHPGSTITFSLPPNPGIMLTSNLVPIEANVTINGIGTPGLKINGLNTSPRLSSSTPGTVTIENMEIKNAAASGGTGGMGGGGGGGGLGAGGAVFVGSSANVTIQNVTFLHNAATGGIGGLGASNNHDGGGGGGGFRMAPAGSATPPAAAAAVSRAPAATRPRRLAAAGGGGGEFGNGGNNTQRHIAGGGGGGGTNLRERTALHPMAPPVRPAAARAVEPEPPSKAHPLPTAHWVAAAGGRCPRCQTPVTAACTAVAAAPARSLEPQGAGGDFGGGGGAGSGNGAGGNGGFGGGGGGASLTNGMRAAAVSAPATVEPTATAAMAAAATAAPSSFAPAAR